MIKTLDAEYQGQWWLPGKEKNRLPGTLSFNAQTGRALLNLIGSFSDLPSALSSRTEQMILGFSTSGKKLSLYRCAPLNANLSFPGIPSIKYDVLRVFVGVHFGDPEEIKFKEISVSFSNSGDWLGATGIKHSLSISEENQKFSLEYTPQKIVETEINEELSLEVLHRATGQPPKHSIDLTEAGIKESVHFRLVASTEQCFNWFLEKIHLLANFLTLGVGLPIFPLAVDGLSEKAILELTNGDRRHERIIIFYLMAERPKLERKRTWDRMLFAYGHIASDFPDMIKNWFAKAELLEPVYDLYFGTLYNSSMYVQHEFLSLAQALETYHRRAFKGRYADDAEYKNVHEALVRAIPETISPEFRESLKGKLLYGHEYSLRKRMKDILGKHKGLLPYVILDTSKFVSNVCDTRNYLTHYDQGLESRALKGNELYILGQKVKFVIELCLLSELGLPNEVINKRLSEDSRYDHVKEVKRP